MEECKICNKSYNTLSGHIRQKHAQITLEQYYNTYIGEPRYCKICGSKLKFISLNKGYQGTYCSYHCRSKDKQYHNKIKDKVIQKYGTSNLHQLDWYKDKIKSTNLQRYGCQKVLSNQEIKKKIKATNLQKYGYQNVAKNQQVKKTAKETNLQRYGCQWACQSQQIRQKIYNTNKEKYGGIGFASQQLIKKNKKTYEQKYGNQNLQLVPQIRQKINSTFNQKYGGIGFQSQQLNSKIRKTRLKRYGTEFSMHNKEIRTKIQNTNLKRYGGISPLSNPQVQFKGRKKRMGSFGLKSYTLKNGSLIWYQSKLQLSFIELCQKNNIHIENGDVIPYMFNGKLRNYYVDFKIKNKNGRYQLIQIKSKHKWFYQDLNSGMLKEKILKANQYCKEKMYQRYRILFDCDIKNFKGFKTH